MVHNFFKARFFMLVMTLCICIIATAQTTVEYDIVLSGGRVIDPETKLDAIRNVGIINNRIAQISSETLKGKETINVSGLVVAPGFIDMPLRRTSAWRLTSRWARVIGNGISTSVSLAA